jgi:hypothetical protein
MGGKRQSKNDTSSIARVAGESDSSARGQASEYQVQARLSELAVPTHPLREIEVDLVALIGTCALYLQVKRMFPREERGVYYRASTRRSGGQAYTGAVHFVIYHCAQEDAYFVVPANHLGHLHEVSWRPGTSFEAQNPADLAPYREAWWLLFYAALGKVPEDVVIRILEEVAPRLALDGRPTAYELPAILDQLVGAWRAKHLPRTRAFPAKWLTLPARRPPVRRTQRLTMDMVMLRLF